MTDVVAGRYDAGIRLGGRLEQDMIALAVGPPLRFAVVAAPSYLRDHPTPLDPADLTAHRCIAYGDANGDLSPWSFERDGRAVTVRPGRGPIILEDLVAAPTADGRLTRLLEPWCAPFAGYHLYYPIGGARPPSNCSRRRFKSAGPYEHLARLRRQFSKLDPFRDAREWQLSVEPAVWRNVCKRQFCPNHCRSGSPEWMAAFEID